MSQQELIDAVDSGAFEPTPLGEELAMLHLPFDDISSARVEGRAAKTLGNWERVAIVGRSGAGKSSVIAHLGYSEGSQLAMITVPMMGLSSDQVGDPVVVGGHLLDAVRRMAAKPVGPQRGWRLNRIEATARVGVPWLSGEIRTQIEKQTGGQVPDSPDQVVGLVQAVLDSATVDGRVPVVVFDDTDRWRAGVGVDPLAFRHAFFDTTLRWMSENLQCGLLVAAHEEYLDDGMPLPTITDKIELPALSTAQIGRVLEHRLEVALGTAMPLAAVLHPDALEALFQYYVDAGQRSIRSTLLKVRQAAYEAADAGHDQVSRHVMLAVAAG